MKKINEFITIIDENNTVDIGKYSVGKNLIPGEYYLWGKDVRYNIKEVGMIIQIMIYVKVMLF